MGTQSQKVFLRPASSPRMIIPSLRSVTSLFSLLLTIFMTARWSTGAWTSHFWNTGVCMSSPHFWCPLFFVESEYPAYYPLNLMALNLTFQKFLMIDFTVLSKLHTLSLCRIYPSLLYPMYMLKDSLYSDLHNFTFTEPEIPTPVSELTETVICALGLTMGLVGIVMGTVFIVQGLRSGGTSRPQGPLWKEGKDSDLKSRRKESERRLWKQMWLKSCRIGKCHNDGTEGPWNLLIPCLSYCRYIAHLQEQKSGYARWPALYSGQVHHIPSFLLTLLLCTQNDLCC